jgi:hypothetical protein
MESLGILSPVDGGNIAIAAEALADVAVAVRAGVQWHRPAELFHRVSSSLGLSPVARTRLVAQAPQPELSEAEQKLSAYGIKPLSVVSAT